jgi:hypothetical protein
MEILTAIYDQEFTDTPKFKSMQIVDTLTGKVLHKHVIHCSKIANVFLGSDGMHAIAIKNPYTVFIDDKYIELPDYGVFAFSKTPYEFAITLDNILTRFVYVPKLGTIISVMFTRGIRCFSRRLKYSKDEKYILLFSTGYFIDVYDRETLTLKTTIDLGLEKYYNIAMASAFVFIQNRDQWKMYNLENGECVSTIIGYQTISYCDTYLVYSLSSKCATISDGTVRKIADNAYALIHCDDRCIVYIDNESNLFVKLADDTIIPVSVNKTNYKYPNFKVYVRSAEID